MRTTLSLLTVISLLTGCGTTRFQTVDSATDFSDLNRELGDKTTAVSLVSGETFSVSGVIVTEDSTTGLTDAGTLRQWRTSETAILSTGTPSQKMKGAGTGAGVGLISGVLIGLMSGDDPSDQFLAWSAGQKALVLGLGLGVIGTAVGAFVSSGGERVDYVFDQNSYVPPADPRFRIAYGWETSIGGVGNSVKAGLDETGFGQTSPGSCFFGCSGPVDYPILRQAAGWRLGADFRVTESVTASAAYLKTGAGSASGYGRGFTYLNVGFETRGFETQISMRPALGKETGLIEAGLGFGVYSSKITMSGFSTSKKTRPGLLAGLVVRPLDRRTGFEIRAMYRLMKGMEFGGGRLLVGPGEGDTIPVMTAKLSGFSLSAGWTIKI